MSRKLKAVNAVEGKSPFGGCFLYTKMSVLRQIESKFDDSVWLAVEYTHLMSELRETL